MAVVQDDGSEALLVHSGTPFRQLLEDDRFDGTKFVEFAAQGSQCSQEHADYITGQGGSIVWLGDLWSGECVAEFSDNVLARVCSGGAGFVSFDIDSIAQSDCPGVSCPANVGISAREAVGIAEAAGSNPGVVIVDVSEFNPVIENYVTPRLVVLILYNFLLGVASRGAPPAEP